MSGHHRSASVCPNCRALNGADFDRCIRCGAAISPSAASIDRLRSHLDGDSLPATKAIIGLTVLAFGLQVAAWSARARAMPAKDLFSDFLFFNTPMAELFRAGALRLQGDALAREPWRLLSAVFVHNGGLHFGLNMLGLANLGRHAERAVGSARFTIAYVLTGIVGFLVTAIYMRGHPYDTVGASGALFGVMGLYVGWLLRRRDPAWKDFAVQAVFYSLLFGFALNAMGVGVNNSAHLGGLVCGTILGVIYAGPRSKSELLPNLAAIAGLVACVASMVLAHQSPLARRLSARQTAPLEQPIEPNVSSD